MGGRWWTLAAAATVVALGLAPGAAAAAPRARALAANRRLAVTVALRPRDPAALAAYAQAVATPGSPDYRRYLTPAQFAGRFGATPRQIGLVEAWLRARGLHPGPVSAGGLSIRLHATVAELERGLRVSLSGAGGRRAAVVASGPPRLGPRARPWVQSVLGLSSVGAPRPLLVRAPSPPRPPAPASGLEAVSPAARSHPITGGPQPCSQARAAAAAQGAHTADQIAHAYDFSGLYGAGDFGSGVTVAVYELEPSLPGDIAAYEACYGIRTAVHYVSVDGGAGAGAGSGEATLDIENLIGLAPGVRVLVYQGPNSDSGNPGAGPYDTFAAIVDQDRATVISVSWGECEAYLGAAGAGAENTLFQQAAVQGQSVIAAAGDEGSEDCAPSGTPQTQLAVDDPASQPFVTGVGGTTLRSAGPRPVESVWNDAGASAGGLFGAGASGGGISNLWPMPQDQSAAPAWLGVRSGLPNGAQCSNPSGWCREVPDVTADADPSTGYVVYWSGGAGQPSGWQAVGGTSAAGPVWAALIALADASPACGGSPLGFAGPALYRAAATAYGQDFNDVTVGNNDFTQTNGGRYGARVGFDQAAGLGSPNAGALARDLCSDTLALLYPGTQRLTEHALVSERLRALDRPGRQVQFSASGLPPGLTVDPDSGVISGRPLRTGTFRVWALARDAEQATATQRFTVVVGSAPRLSHVALRSAAGSGPRLSLMVAAGRGAPALWHLELALPHGLAVASTRGVTVGTRTGRGVRFRVRRWKGGLLIALHRPLEEVTITLRAPALRVLGLHRRRSAELPAGASRLQVTVRDASRGLVSVSAGVRIGAP